VRDFEPEYGTVMRRIATCAGLCAVEVLAARISVFFHAFKSLERLPKLATSYNRVGRGQGCSGTRLVRQEPVGWRFHTNFQAIYTMHSGKMSVFAVGLFDDLVVLVALGKSAEVHGITKPLRNQVAYLRIADRLVLSPHHLGRCYTGRTTAAQPVYHDPE
jgi:hypothetical protein